MSCKEPCAWLFPLYRPTVGNGFLSVRNYVTNYLRAGGGPNNLIPKSILSHPDQLRRLLVIVLLPRNAFNLWLHESKQIADRN